MNGHTAVEHHGTLYSFGGYRDEVILDTVFRLVEYYWTDEFYWYITEFNLKKPRYNHRTVVQVNSKYLDEPQKNNSGRYNFTCWRSFVPKCRGVGISAGSVDGEREKVFDSKVAI